jgi:ABC-type transport system substrate-binding protein
MYSTNAFTALAGFTTTMNGNGIDNKTAEHVLHCSGFSDAAYDAILERAYAEKDLEKRAAILHEAEKYLMEKLPVMPIVYNQNYYIIDGVSGVDVDGYGNLIFDGAKAPVAKVEEEEPEEEEEY